MPSNIKSDSEDDEYNPSESDEDYTENEKNLLNKVRNKKVEYSDSEEEVFAVRSAGEDSESDDDKSDLAVSDIEGQEDDDLPDIRAWGKDKRQFYKTDYVDPDYGGFEGKDAQLAEIEEKEARNLQKQLAQQLDDADFNLDIFAKKPAEDEKVTEEIVKTDVSKLSKRQKLQILEKESPELFSLIDDYKSKMTLVKDYLYPIIQKFKAGQLPKGKAVDFIQTQYGIILNYCMNIYMYLYLKSTKTNVQNHPVIKRLYQFRQLLLKLEPLFEEVLKPQIELILEQDSNATKAAETIEKKKKTLKLLASLTKKPEENDTKKKKKRMSVSEDEKPGKKVKFADEVTEEIVDDNEEKKKKILENSSDESSESEEEANVDENKNGDDNNKEPTKRAITYKMAKNKGLMPHRKKEQRNPRVKHRMKYRKAVIRRKGAVREPRKELSRYGGEISGIKANVSRSVKIKS